MRPRLHPGLICICLVLAATIAWLLIGGEPEPGTGSHATARDARPDPRDQVSHTAMPPRIAGILPMAKQGAPADSIEVQSRADRVVIAGKVVVEQAGLTLSAARMTVAYSDSSGVDVNRIDAVGGVTVVKGGDRATGNSAIYDLDRRIITMLGNVQLVQGANRLNGGRLVIDLTTGRASVDGRGSAVSGSSPGSINNQGGRVTGRFTVPDRN